MAKSILKQNKDLNVVVMGHTHLIEWRKFPEGKLYFNTGTWNPIPSIDAGMHESMSALTYVAINVHEKSNEIDTASLNICLTYGPRQSLNSLIPYTINSLITAEKKVNLKLNRYLDILFVDDVINAMLKAGLTLGSIRPTYIGTSQNITVKEITTLIAELMDKDHNLI